MTPDDISESSIETVEIDVPDGVALSSVAHPGSVPRRKVRVRLELEMDVDVLVDWEPHCIEERWSSPATNHCITQISGDWINSTCKFIREVK